MTGPIRDADTGYHITASQPSPEVRRQQRDSRLRLSHIAWVAVAALVILLASKAVPQAAYDAAGMGDYPMEIAR